MTCPNGCPSEFMSREYSGGESTEHSRPYTEPHTWYCCAACGWTGEWSMEYGFTDLTKGNGYRYYKVNEAGPTEEAGE